MAPQLGPHTVRMKTEVRAADGRRHATALDVAQLDVVTAVPPGMGTCTPTPTPTITAHGHPDAHAFAHAHTDLHSYAGAARPDGQPPGGQPGDPERRQQHPADRIASARWCGLHRPLASSRPMAGVTGQLKGYRGSTLLGTVAPFNPGGEHHRRPAARLAADQPHAELRGAVRLADGGRAAGGGGQHRPLGGRKQLRATTRHRSTSRFVDGGDLRIAWLPIHYVTGGYTGPQDPTARITKGDAWLKATYPVSHTRVKYYPWPGHHLGRQRQHRHGRRSSCSTI